MRRIWTCCVRALLVLPFLCSCEGEFHCPQQEGNRPIEVGFYAGGADTRTHMQPDGLSACWVAGDELALWAGASSGDFVLSNQTFITYGLDGKRGFFTSTLDSAMPEDTYTYYCCYPKPLAVNGTEVTFNLPAVQDGKASGGADIMIATPVQHGALTPVPEPEDHSGMAMSMNHMMHQFRFYIPADNTVLQDEAVEKIKLTFPKSVVGNVNLDISDPGKAAVLSEGSGEIVLNLAEPLTITQAPTYACVAFVPAAFAEGESMQVKAYTSDRIVKVDPIDLYARDFQAGHSTPVKLIATEIVDYPYRITFNVSANNLGEDVNSIIMTAPENCVWPESGSNVFTYSPGHDITSGENIVVNFEEESMYRAFSGANIAVTYDSDHALTSEVITIGQLSDINAVNVSLTIPYLFFEDFSTLAAYENYEHGVHTSVDGASVAAIDLSQYGLSSGWTGARTGCDNAGTAILISGRVDIVKVFGIGGATRGYGRLDSPALNNLKNGVAVRLSVSFDYSGSTDNSKFYPVGVCGYIEQSGLINGYATQFNDSEAWSDIFDYSAIPDIPTSGSATSMDKSMTCTIDDCTSNSRLSWHVAGMGGSGISNGYQWMYLDNIKVQIAE